MHSCLRLQLRIAMTCALAWLAPSEAAAQSFTCGTIHSMHLQRSPAGTGATHRLIVDHAAWGQCGFPAPSVQMVLVDPGTTVIRGVAGSFGGCNSFSAGSSNFDFTPPPGGPYEIRLYLVAFGPNPWICWSSFAVPVSGTTASAQPYGTTYHGANVLLLGGAGTAGSTSDYFVTGLQSGAAGYYFIGSVPDAIAVLGGTLLVDQHALLVIPAMADGTGVHRLRAPLSPGLAGRQFYMQAIFSDAAQARGIAFSQGLRATL